MKCYFNSIFLLVISLNSFCQKNKKVNLYLGGHFTLTLDDRTSYNNIWGFGAAATAIVNTKTKLKPIATVNTSLMVGTKVLRLTIINGTEQIDESIDTYSTFLIGGNYSVSNKWKLIALSGVAFINGNKYVTIRGGVGYFIDKNKQWQISTQHEVVLNRLYNEEFTNLQFSLAKKLF